MLKEFLWRLGLGKRALPLWYDPAYWLPVSIPGRPSMEPRRADFVAWYLNDLSASSLEMHSAEKISYRSLRLVHTDEYLGSLQSEAVLGRIFGLEGVNIPANALVHSMRAACGATVSAAREALSLNLATMNLLGGFHHAAPGRGGGFCVFNDIALAVAVLRAEGFSGKVSILDLDAHPPDGTALCFAGDKDVWLGSLSGSSWEALPGVDETLLPRGCNDDTYLIALESLLSRMPSASLYFVIAGGDVLLRDELGQLGLTLTGARQRDMMIERRLHGSPSVWLPGGGYHPETWKVLAGTALALMGLGEHWIPSSYQPITERFSSIAKRLNFPQEGDWLGLTEADLEGSLSRAPSNPEKLLHFYTKEGAEYALVQYGLWGRLEQLGYQHLVIAFESVPLGERLLISGEAMGAQQHLVDCVISQQQVAGEKAIFIHWLQLRHPLAKKQDIPKHALLPGQDAPGLGLSREVGELFRQISLRIGAAGVALCPAWYHVAFSARQDFRFVDPARQGRFEAMLRDLGSLSTKKASTAIAEGLVSCDGEPYQWEATEMISWRVFSPEEQAALESAKSSRFTIAPA